MSYRPLAAVATLAILAVAGSVAAQVGTRSPSTIQRAQPATPILHQPSNLELQLKIEELNQTVAQLSDRLGALNQHIASISGQFGTLNTREIKHYAQVEATAYQTCKLLYQHHWAPNGANPTPGNPYVPDDYCRAQGWQDTFAQQ